MFAGQFSRAGSLSEEPSPINATPQKPPSSLLAKCKYYYDKYKLHRVSACICLLLYSFIGAWLFYLVENEYEQEVKKKERLDLWNLRNHTFQHIVHMVHRGETSDFERVFVDYEKKLHQVRLPESLDWDYWGALFYVGTLFTTIGYGNIAPRTNVGRALSVLYAIIGIPLVLAILSKCGKSLTTTLSQHWQQHRRKIKLKAKKTTNRLRGRRVSILDAIERGGLPPKTDEDDDEIESRTIPIWLALLICVVFVCGCSSLFLIWETRWTFFTSLYFFCISLSTIGLGDIVPDHPHMFIIMFVLVILGLSIVSMLISVIQIKMEEWLYHLIKKIQQEYNRALESGESIDREAVLRNVMTNEPTWMQLVAPTMLTGQQNDKLEQKVEQFERLMKESKDVQTDVSVAFASTQVERNEQSMACDPMSQHQEPVQLKHQSTQWLTDLETRTTHDYRDSISDATSLPMDSISAPPPEPEAFQTRATPNGVQCQTNDFSLHSNCAQTDLAQFQIDEIAIKLANLQSQRVRPPIVERSMATSMYSNPSVQYVEDETQTSIAQKIDRVSSPIRHHHHHCVDAQTSTACNPTRDMNTSTSEPERDDRSQQTSLAADLIAKLFRQNNDQSQQTSLIEDIKLRKKKKSQDQSEATTSSISEIKKDAAMIESVTMSTQYSPPPLSSSEQMANEERRSSEQGLKIRGRSMSTSGVGTSIFDDETRQEVIVQTDDSYLKIARRLDEYRNNKTQFLPVCAAPPLSSKDLDSSQKTDRPSERSHYYFGANMARRLSFGRNRKKSSRRESSTGKSMDADMLHQALSTNDTKSRSISPPHRLRPNDAQILSRIPSLPTGISRGKVSDYVNKHEKGIPNPATNRSKPVQIIRQYSLDTS